MGREFYRNNKRRKRDLAGDEGYNRLSAYHIYRRDDLKNGDILKTMNENVFILFDNLMIGSNEERELDEYDYDLNDKFSDKDDIIQVLRMNRNTDFCFENIFNENSQKSLWYRHMFSMRIDWENYIGQTIMYYHEENKTFERGTLCYGRYGERFSVLVNDTDSKTGMCYIHPRHVKLIKNTPVSEASENSLNFKIGDIVRFKNKETIDNDFERNFTKSFGIFSGTEDIYEKESYVLLVSDDGRLFVGNDLENKWTGFWVDEKLVDKILKI